MNNLLDKSNLRIQRVNTKHIRSLMSKIDWTDRLIGILGARGTGKTTMMLQQLKRRFGLGTEAIYITMDDIYFTNNTLVDFIETFRTNGGKAIYIDEVHKYPDWAREIKNIYDFYDDIQIVFTGSSITDILRQNADLSRRAVQYELTGLSFREFLEVTSVVNIPILPWEDLLSKHTQVASDINSIIKPIQHFKEYLQYGYYPFFLENKKTYHLRLENIIRLIVEVDLQFIKDLDKENIRKVFQLLYILAANVPFKPNISKLSEKIGIHRNLLVEYLHFLDKAKLINSLAAEGKSINILQKPEKIYLENTNLQYTLAPSDVDKGTLREAFFCNQLQNAGHKLSIPLQGDFMVDSQWTFEIGGKGKTIKQIADTPNAWIAMDDIEIGAYGKIPLWLFGILY
jgi:uncharacterized protein